MFKTLKCSEIHCGAGVKYYHQGMIGQAIDAYHEILRQSTTKCHIVYCWLGIAYFHKKISPLAEKLPYLFLSCLEGE